MNASDFSNMILLPVSKCTNPACNHLNVNIRPMRYGDIDIWPCRMCNTPVKFVTHHNEELQNMSGYRIWMQANLRRRNNSESEGNGPTKEECP
jgi:transcription elongation factor Elf1